MKILSRISFIILIGLICLTQTTLSAKCITYKRPIFRYEKEVIDCPIVSSNDKRQTQATPDNMFVVNFNCSVADKVLCNKVQNVFVTAGKFITATINLKSVVSVDAKFLDFCANFGECDTQAIILGAAGPARFIPFQDNDKVRLLPQALYKQLNLPQHPQFGPNEIMATFNSNMTYWFEGDPLPMLRRQADLLYVVLHELVHGLGFVNSWNDEFGLQVLTPMLGQIVEDNPIGGLPPTPKTLFLETIFDKNLVILPDGVPLTTVTDQLNQFQFTPTTSEQDFISSQQFQIAKGIYNDGITSDKIGFVLTPGIPKNVPLTQDQIQNNVLILETSLNPFMPSSSIGHSDFRTYLNSGDFLMLFTYPPGKTLGEMLDRSNTTSTTGPIGPRLRTLLGIIGYDIKQDYTPPTTLSTIQSNDNTTNSSDNNNAKPLSSSSIVSSNLVLSLVCILSVISFI
ncbi:hypothetical protein C1645_776596 [Glomus cerebriforme]|uniref:Sequence orphan n=1 Tax=Glomus cerebriforme TaxID=658196 RepID=A0A397SNY4_9GLOM|nr:hypothetical protein C1645_776596 [Glomus cerebriforme]